MQIDRYNHLQFPRDAAAGGNAGGGNPATTGKDSAASAAGASGLQARPQPALGAQVPTRVASRTESVVLKIQWPGATPGSAKPVDTPLYTPGRRMPVAGDESDTGARSREHQLAVDRQAAGGNVTPIAVSKDGVLVAARATPHAAEKAEAAQPDFVALAVSALREYRDDPERQRLAATQAPAPEAHWSALKGLQQIAAKLNVFA